MLQHIEQIQKQWLNKNKNELDIPNLPLPENIKAAISQADKQDQKRECLILMAQMQTLLSKPTPKELKPQVEPLPMLEGCRYLSTHSKEVHKITKLIIEKNIDYHQTPSLKFLASNQVIIKPSEYFDFLTDCSERKQGIQPRAVLSLDIYRPWWHWGRRNFTHKPKVLTKEELINGKWTPQRFKEELFYYDSNYNLIDALDVILAHEDEDLHEAAIYVGRSYYKEIPISYLRKQYKNHPSERTRIHIGKILKKKGQRLSVESYIEDITDCLILEDNRLYNKYSDSIEPHKVNYYIRPIHENNLWQEVAKHFNLTISQFFEYWDMTSFKDYENNCFYKNFEHYKELPQEVIDKTYLKINNFIKNGIINNNPVSSTYYYIMAHIAKWTSFQVKKQLDYDYFLDENGFFKSISLGIINKINETFIPRFSLKEAIFCLENIAINADNSRKYVYDKVKSRPYSDDFLFKLSKETAQDYLDHLLDSGITDQTSKRDRDLLNSLRLNILINSEKDK